MKIRFNKEESGQALIEMSFGFIIMCVFVFGAIDFGRAVYDSEVMKNLAGEGSSMAARSTPILTVASTVLTYAGSDIDLAHNGCIIITTVTNVSGTAEITAQTPNSICGSPAASKIGCVIGTAGCGTPTLPAGARLALLSEPSGSFLSVTEIYYNFSPITPIAGLMRGNLLPSQMYAVAYY
jgi:Flp pilus assembly protein TadG